MPPRIGMSREQKIEFLSRLNRLSSFAHELIVQDRRSAAEVDVLLHALEAFKADQLRGIIRPTDMDSDKAELFGKFSLPIERTSLPDKQKDYLLERGVRYVGEMYYLHFHTTSKLSLEKAERFFGHLEKYYGLGSELDPLAMGWRPSYWDDKAFRAALDMECYEAFGDRRDRWFVRERVDRQERRYSAILARRLYLEGVCFLAQYILQDRDHRMAYTRSNNGWCVGYLKAKQTLLRTVDAPLWAAALVPPDWKPPRTTPVWAKFSAAPDPEHANWYRIWSRQQARDTSVEASAP